MILLLEKIFKSSTASMNLHNDMAIIQKWQIISDFLKNILFSHENLNQHFIKKVNETLMHVWNNVEDQPWMNIRKPCQIINSQWVNF